MGIGRYCSEKIVQFLKFYHPTNVCVPDRSQDSFLFTIIFIYFLLSITLALPLHDHKSFQKGELTEFRDFLTQGI